MVEAGPNGVGPSPAAIAEVARRATAIRRRLLTWGKHHYQSFAWRDESDPWLCLVAETFLQRTGARQAESVFKGFKAEYPKPSDLVAGGSPAVAELTSRLGLHWRGPLLFRLAEIAALRGLPENEEELRRLPGVGPYAAAAWLSLHRGKRAVIVDNNVARWLCRMTGAPYTAESRRKVWLKKLADSLTPLRSFRAYNYAVLDFTMAVCAPRTPRCHVCPLISVCSYGASRRLDVNHVGAL